MSVAVHPTAVLAPDVELEEDVEVAPYAVIGSRVRIGARTRLGPHAVLDPGTTVGRDCRIGAGAVLGSPPQDRSYGGEATRLVVGDETVVREYCTINRGTTATGETRVGARCFLMTYVHVAHDCVVEDEVTLANAVQLGGHVHVESRVTLGGSTSVHQFVRIGTYAFVGGASRVAQDIPPYAKAAGNPLKLYGINSVGLDRAGLAPESRHALKRAFRLLFNSTLTVSDAIPVVRRDHGDVPEVRRLLDFFARSGRGVPV